MIKKADMDDLREAFYSEPEESVPQQSPVSQPESWGRKEKAEFLARGVGRTAKASGSAFFGKYGDIQDLAQKGINTAFGADDEEIQKWKEKQEPDEFQPFGAPLTTGKIKKGLETIFPSLAPRTPGEQKYEDAIELGTSLADPSIGGKVGLLRPLLGTAAGMGAEEIAETMGASPEQKGWAKTLASIIPMVVKGGVKPGSGEALELYNAGKDFQMTDAQLAPLLHSEKKLAYLGKIAKRSGSTEAAIESSQEGLGNLYTHLKDMGSMSRPLSYSGVNRLKSKLNNFKKELSNTLATAPEKQAVIDHVDKMLSRLQNTHRFGRRVNIETLVNSFQDINKTVNWNAIKGGKKALAEAKDFLVEGIREMDPGLADNFLHINRLQTKMYDFAEAVGHSKGVENFIKGSEVATFLSGIVTMNPYAIGTPILAETGRKLFEMMLINPKFQNITKNTMQAILKQSPKATLSAYKQLKDAVRSEMPEEYEEIDWPEE